MERTNHKSRKNPQDTHHRSGVPTNTSPTKHTAFDPPQLGRYTGLKGKELRHWKQWGPERYITELLRQTLQDVKQVQVQPCPVRVSTRDKVMNAVKGGTVGFSVSFMLAKAWTSLWGLLSTLRPDDPRTFFLIGAGGYALIASFSHATLAKVAGFAPGANYGGPQAPDRDAFSNYITLLGMWYVAKGDHEDELADRIALAIQEQIDGVIARAQKHENEGHPLCFDFRQHPMLGAWLRNGHFHLAFFWYSIVYLLSGGLAPLMREAIQNLSGSVLKKAGLYNLGDFLLSATCGQFAGVFTLGVHMLGNRYIQRGQDKPGLHQSWPEELKAARDRLALLNTGWSALSGIRNHLVSNLAKPGMGKKKRAQYEAMLKEQLLPGIDKALEQLEKKQLKWIKRSRNLTTAEGRFKVAAHRAGDLAFQGAGKTAHKLINQSQHAPGLRSAGEVLGNLPSLLPMAYALVTMYTLFATFMPFAGPAQSVPTAANGTAPWSTPLSHPGVANHTMGEAGVPQEVQAWSTLLGWLLIAGFSGIRPFSIPGAELLLNLLLAAALRVGHWTGLRQRVNPAAPDIEQLPPPPGATQETAPNAQPHARPASKPRKLRFDDDKAVVIPQEALDSPRDGGPSSDERPDVMLNMEFSEEEVVVTRDASMPGVDEIPWQSSLSEDNPSSGSHGASDSSSSDSPVDERPVPPHLTRQPSVVTTLLNIINDIKPHKPDEKT